MTHISYAQNYEDIILWRALKDVPKGFYIDVGANEAVRDSVTKLFYDKGWSGINIEPVKSYFHELKKLRPRDININCAVGESEGELELFDVSKRGWATLEQDVARMHEEQGCQIKKSLVLVRPLSDVCEEFVDQPIHFLKVDVEGFEEKVLKGMDFEKYRPWIVVVESTKPNTQEEDYSGWEGILTDTNYVFCYFDGLNRFYVAREHESLVSSISVPPNVFDDFIRYDEAQARDRLNKALSSISSLQDHVKLAEAHAADAERRYQHVEQMYSAILSSISWRITYPLRWSRRFLANTIIGTYYPKLKRFLKAFIKSVAIYLFKKIEKRPRLKSLLIDLLRRYKPLFAYMQRVFASAKAEKNVANMGNVVSVSDLSPRARYFFDELKKRINGSDIK